MPVFRLEDYDPEPVANRFRKHGASAIVSILELKIGIDGERNERAELTHLKGFGEGYMEILGAATHPHNKSRLYAAILKHLSSPERPDSILIHCSAGKDRTGIICALILSLCGVDDDIIAEEYSLSDIGLKELHSEMVDVLLQKAVFQSNVDEASKLVLARYVPFPVFKDMASLDMIDD